MTPLQLKKNLRQAHEIAKNRMKLINRLLIFSVISVAK